MDWLADPWTIGLLALGAAVAFAASAFRHWSLRATVEYSIGAVLMLFAVRWATEIGSGAIYAVAVAGIGTGLATRAIERSTRAADAGRRSRSVGKQD